MSSQEFMNLLVTLDRGQSVGDKHNRFIFKLAMQEVMDSTQRTLDTNAHEP